MQIVQRCRIGRGNVSQQNIFLMGCIRGTSYLQTFSLYSILLASTHSPYLTTGHLATVQIYNRPSKDIWFWSSDGYTLSYHGYMFIFWHLTTSFHLQLFASFQSCDDFWQVDFFFCRFPVITSGFQQKKCPMDTMYSLKDWPFT